MENLNVLPEAGAVPGKPFGKFIVNLVAKRRSSFRNTFVGEYGTLEEALSDGEDAAKKVERSEVTTPGVLDKLLSLSLIILNTETWSEVEIGIPLGVDKVALH